MKTIVSSVCMALAMCASSFAAPIFSSTDFIIAIDRDDPVSFSNYPGGEDPLFALDSDSSTKYLNFGEVDTGFIVTPFIGATTAQSIQFTTANDFPARDPASWQLFGTNDPITSVDNSTGSEENWSLIAGGDLALSDDRFTASAIVPFTNATAYLSYRVIFPTVKDAAGANSMQIADVNLFDDPDGLSFPIWTQFDPVLAVQLPQPASVYPAAEPPPNLLDGTSPVMGIPSESGYPGAEGPENTVDGTLAKYLNTGDANSGFIVTPSSGPSQVQSFQITTANDAPERDPTSWELWGTDETIVSTDNSFGLGENWALIDSGDITLPPERDTLGPVVSVTNNDAFTSYKMNFPTINGADLMQIAEAAFFESADGTGTNVLAPGDTVLAIDADTFTGADTKYLNFGEDNSGFIITPAAGPSTVNEFQVITADDAVERDPMTWELYGTNDEIASEDNSQGDGENWELIDSGTFDENSMPMDRTTEGDVVAVDNDTEYASYRMVFTSVRDAETANSMQVAGIQFFGDVMPPMENADFDGSGLVDGNDFLILQRNMNMAGSQMDGDANGDGQVNAADLDIWEMQYGGAPPAAAVATAVPEPASAALLLLAACGVTAIAGRRSLRL